MAGLPLEHLISHKMMLDFEGTSAPGWLLDLIEERPIAGVTLYRRRNIETPTQVQALTAALQDAAKKAGHLPLLIAADQEGGQLMAIGDGATPFAGNMALGAASSPELARRVGQAIGRELAAMGINVNYAPVCDVLTNPNNPNSGIRPFGDDPVQAGALAAALVEGLQSAGVAATAKHFPGHGEAATDPHFETPVVLRDRAHLDTVELPPFARAIKAGVKLIMTTHAAYPALTGGAPIPATLAKPILQGILRTGLKYDGLVITDALNMGAITQGIGQAIDVIASTLAGVDLLLMGSDADVREAVTSGLAQAVRRGLIPKTLLAEAARRVKTLKGWVDGQAAPPIDVVGCAEHQELARELAEASITLVRDDAKLLPLRLDPQARVLVVIPTPEDLTPADTSSHVRITLADIIREDHANVDAILTAHRPGGADVDQVVEHAQRCDLVIIGTIAAHMQPSQAEMVRRLHQTGKPLIVLALRTPYDLLAFPEVSTYACAYGILEPSMRAVTRALWGEIPWVGRLPVALGDLYPRGHGIALAVREAS